MLKHLLYRAELTPNVLFTYANLNKIDDRSTKVLENYFFGVEHFIFYVSLAGCMQYMLSDHLLNNLKVDPLLFQLSIF